MQHLSVCAVPGCERQREFSNGYCGPHYKRWKRNGNPGPPGIRRRNPGATCAVPACSRPLGKSGSHGYCQKHAYRFRRNRDPLITRKPGSPAGQSHHSFIAGAVSYDTVHAMLKRQLGPASNRQCIECSGPAAEWAYQHGASNELHSEQGNPYSLDADDYRPMCVACHRAFDAAHGMAFSPGDGVIGSNTSGFRGVSYSRKANKWRAYATRFGVQYYGGQFSTAEEAAVAAQALRRRLASGWELGPA